jgi:malonate transporter
VNQFGEFAAFLLPVMLPVIGLIALGRIAVGVRMLDAAGTRSLTDLVFWVLMPSLLFLSVAGDSVPGGFSTTFVYFAVAVPIYAGSLLIGRLWLGLTASEAAIFGLNAVFGNVVMIGIPIVSAVWGPPALAAVLSIVAAHSVILLPLATVAMELGRGERTDSIPQVVGHSLLATLKNPIVSSILVAFVWRATGLPLPAALRRLLELMGQAGPTLALICLGASLPPLGRASTRPVPLTAAAIKLLLMPLAMTAAVTLAGVPWPAGGALILASALPTGANAFLLARRGQAMLEESAATMVIATIAAAFTLCVVLAATR